jgi:(4S)-4-hydroxy-5-phosphonooxypentane-2,3-dione isomerase
MLVRIITCQVKPGLEAAFEAATTENRAGSVAEPGVLRFDVLKDSQSSGTYYLYEVYRDDAATAAHKGTDHYKRWRETVAEHMAAPRTSAACSVVAPDSEAEW